MIATDLITGWWATDPLFCVAVGFLAAVEIASGILQGYYTPIFSDIADHLAIPDGDVNWFEAAQLIVAARVLLALLHQLLLAGALGLGPHLPLPIQIA